MSKKLAIEILQEAYDNHVRAMAGGVVGDDEEKQIANYDLKRYYKALYWAKHDL